MSFLKVFFSCKEWQNLEFKRIWTSNLAKIWQAFADYMQIFSLKHEIIERAK